MTRVFFSYLQKLQGKTMIYIDEFKIRKPSTAATNNTKLNLTVCELGTDI